MSSLPPSSSHGAPPCGRRTELLGVGPKLIGVVGAEGMVHTSPVTHEAQGLRRIAQ